MNKKIYLGILSIVLVIAAVYLVQNKKQALASMAAPEPLPVVLESVRLTPRHITLTLPATAAVRAVEEAAIASRLSGYVLEVRFSEGDRFAKGDVLLRIDDTQARAELLRAQAELAQIRLQKDVRDADLAAANSALKVERERLERMKALYSIEGISLEQLQQAETAFAMAEARSTASSSAVASYRAALNAAEAALDAANQNIAYATIRAPFDGALAARHVQVGDLVSPGKPLMSVVKTGDVRLLVDLPPDLTPESVRVSGQRLPVKRWPSATTRGMTRFEARTAGLTPGSTLAIDVVVFERDGLFLPHQCSMESDGQSARVLKIEENGKSKTVKVTLAANGIEGAAVDTNELDGARVACGSNDLLVRAASGAPFQIDGGV